MQQDFMHLFKYTIVHENDWESMMTCLKSIIYTVFNEKTKVQWRFSEGQKGHIC